MPLDTRKIPQSEWDRHQHTIRALYHNEKLPLSNQKGERCVVSVMRDEHGFAASLSQYEAQLRRWESQKNLKKHEWAFLLSQYDTVVARGCSARIVSSGLPLSESRIIRARRHLQNSGNLSSVASAPRQAFVEYQNSRRDWIRYSPANRAPAHDRPSSQMPATLALRNSGGHDVAQSVPENEDDLEALGWPQSSSISSGTGSTERHESTGSAQNLCLRGLYGQLSLREPVMAAEAFGGFHNPAQLNFRLANSDSFLSHPRNTGQPSAGCLVRTSTFRAHHAPVELGADVTLHPIAQQMIGQLSYLALGDMGISSLELSSREPRNDIPTLVQAIAYSFSNRTEVSRRAHHETVFGLLRQDKSLQNGLQELLQTVQPSVGMCLADNLFRHAVETGDPQATKMILGMVHSKFAYVINPDKIKCTIVGRDGNFTPLEVASAQRNIDLARVLLEVGADPNHSFWKGFDHIQGALESTLWTNARPDTRPPVNAELVQLFLSHKATVRPETLRLLLQYPLIERRIVEDVIGRIEPKDHGLYFPATAPRDIILKESGERIMFADRYLMPDIVCIFKNSTSFSAIVAFFSKCDATVCAHLQKQDLLTPLLLAARRGNLELTEFLLPMVSSAPLQELLVAAIRSGEMKLIDRLLEKGVSVDGPAAPVIHLSGLIHIKDEIITFLKEMTPLAEAIRCENETLIRRLEDLGALSCIGIGKEQHYKAATTAAAYTGNIQYLQVLLEKGSALDGTLLSTALTAAIASNHLEVASLLLAHMGPGGWSSQNIELALENSISCRNKMAFNLLMEFSSANAPYSVQATKDAILWGDIEVLDWLALSDDGFPNTNNSRPPLTLATLEGDKVVVEWLLGHRANLAEATRDISPLAAAALRADTEMVKLFLTHRASVKDEYALIFAMSYSEDIFKTLLSVFASQFPSGYPGFGSLVLTRAVHDGKVCRVNQLLKAKIGLPTSGSLSHSIISFEFEILSIDRKTTWGIRLRKEMATIRNFRGLSALGCAISMNGRKDRIHVDMVRMLLEAGANLNIFASKSPYQTPLLLAIRHGDTELLELLVQYGAGVNIRPRGMRYTPLQLACQQGNFAMVVTLLQQGADVRAAPSPVNGGTALQMASQSGNIKIAQLLIDNGADVHEPPCQFGGRTAFEGAAKEGRITMLEFLWAQACPAGFPRAELERARSLAEEGCHRGCVEYIDLLLIIVGDATTPRLSVG